MKKTCAFIKVMQIKRYIYIFYMFCFWNICASKISISSTGVILFFFQIGMFQHGTRFSLILSQQQQVLIVHDDDHIVYG